MAAGGQLGRRLQGDEREHLEEVGDDHVLVGAGRLVEVRALVEPQLLGHVDLDVVDVVAVPDRLEQPVGEAEREDVLRRLLPEEVVDPVDLRLVEGLVELGVERLGRRQVDAERLLHDDPAALDELRLVEGLHHRQGRLGRDAQVVQADPVAVQAGLGLLHRRSQPGGPPLGTGRSAAAC